MIRAGREHPAGRTGDAGDAVAPLDGRSRVLLAVLVLLLIAAAFARAQFASTTGVRLVGDGADYAQIAMAPGLEGRAPFVYRPAVPKLVGTLFAGDPLLGFVLVCALAMFAALYGAGLLAPDPFAAYGVAALLFFNYQVLFAAANPARIDVVVLAVQVGFVALALRGAGPWFFALLPLCALLKESLLLSLGALALVAFAGRRELRVMGAVSAAIFLAVHALVRVLAAPTSQMPPYDDGVPGLAGALEMLAGNLSPLTPLDFWVAWGGLCLVVAWALVAGGGPLRWALVAGLLLFPLPLATDVHRAWFELLAPLALFLLLPRLRRRERHWTHPTLALALVASIVPYAYRFVGVDHLYLLVLEARLGPAALLFLALALIAAGAAAYHWVRGTAEAERDGRS